MGETRQVGVFQQPLKEEEMNLANLVNLTNAEMGLICVEGTVVLTFLLLMRYIRQGLQRSAGKRPASLHSNSVSDWVRESEKICENLSKNLEEKKEIADRLVMQL